MRFGKFASLVVLLSSAAFAGESLHLKSVYSRGNDDIGETNHETAKIILELVACDLEPNKLAVELRYSALFSVDHPHNPASANFWLKQRFNEIEPNLTASNFTYTPGPDGSSLHGSVTGAIFLGELNRAKEGPVRGRIAVTSLPDFDPNSPVPVDSWIDWGFLMKDGKAQLGELSLHAQWKGITRPSEEMLRLVDSSFVDPSAFRQPFSAKPRY